MCYTNMHLGNSFINVHEIASQTCEHFPVRIFFLVMLFSHMPKNTSTVFERVFTKTTSYWASRICHPTSNQKLPIIDSSFDLSLCWFLSCSLSTIVKSQLGWQFIRLLILKSRSKLANHSCAKFAFKVLSWI